MENGILTTSGHTDYIGTGSAIYNRVTLPSADTTLHNEKHHLTVNEGLYGYSLKVGCQTLYCTSSDEVTKLVKFYLKNKKECLKAYSENTLEELVKTTLNK